MRRPSVGIHSYAVYLSYVDESGNTGLPGSRTFTVACLFLEDVKWPDAFDRLIEFRRELHRTYGVPVRAELKANYLLRGKGPLWRLSLSEQQRFEIYRAMMRVQAELGLQTYAIVVNKQELVDRDRGEDAREVAWEFLVQRLERLTTTTRTPAMIVHDEGEGLLALSLGCAAQRSECQHRGSGQQ